MSRIITSRAITITRLTQSHYQGRHLVNLKLFSTTARTAVRSSSAPPKLSGQGQQQQQPAPQGGTFNPAGGRVPGTNGVPHIIVHPPQPPQQGIFNAAGGRVPGTNGVPHIVVTPALGNNSPGSSPGNSPTGKGKTFPGGFNQGPGRTQ